MSDGPQMHTAPRAQVAVAAVQSLATVKAPSTVLPSELISQFSIKPPGQVCSVEVSSIAQNAQNAQADPNLKQGFVAICWSRIEREEGADGGNDPSFRSSFKGLTNGVEIYSYGSTQAEQPKKLEIPALANLDVKQCFFDRSGSTLFVIDSKGDIGSIDLTNPNAEVKLPFGRARFLERSNDTSLIAVVTRDESGNSPDQKLILHQTANSEWKALFSSLRTDGVVAFSADGKKIASVENGIALVFDRHNLGDEKGLLRSHVLHLAVHARHSKVHKIVFSPDGQSIAILEGRRNDRNDASVRNFTIHLRRLDDPDFSSSVKCGTSFTSAPPQFTLGTQGELFVSGVNFTGQFRPSLTQLLRSFVTFSADGSKSRPILNDATLELSTSRSGDIIAVLPNRLHLKALSAPADGTKQKGGPVMCKIVTLSSDFVHQAHSADSTAPNYLAAQTESFTFAALAHGGDRLVTVAPAGAGLDEVKIFS